MFNKIISGMLRYNLFLEKCRSSPVSNKINTNVLVLIQ